MATYYWVSGGNGLWSSSSNWSLSSGGAGGAGVPSTSDTVILDTNSPTITLDTSPTIGVLNASNFNKPYPYGKFNFVTYSLTLTGAGTVLSGHSNVVVECSPGYTPVIYLTNPLNAGLTLDWYAFAWESSVVGTVITTGVSVVFGSGTYSVYLQGNYQDLDFLTNSYSGTVELHSTGFYGTVKLSSTMSFTGYTGGDFYASGTNSKFLSNGIYVDARMVVIEYFQGAPSLTILDAMSVLGLLAYDGSFNMNGKNVTTTTGASFNSVSNTFYFGSGTPTFTMNRGTNFYGSVNFSGQGTATLAYTGNNGGIYCTVSGVTIPATINQTSAGQMTVSKGSYLNIRNTGYGTVKFTGPVRFVDFNLRGKLGTPLTVQGTAASTSVFKVDPWYVGPNSTDAGGNTNIIFSGAEGSDYLTVSNLSGTYDYGPHFMAFM